MCRANYVILEFAHVYCDLDTMYVLVGAYWNRIPPSHRDWEIEAVSSLAPRSLRKVFLGCKVGKRLLKTFTSQRERERIYNCTVSKEMF